MLGTAACSRGFWQFSRHQGRLIGRNGLRSRSLATTAGLADTSTLPLAGIRVLDMTRVLAGVCFCVLFLVGGRANSLHSHTAHKFLATWGTCLELVEKRFLLGY